MSGSKLVQRYRDSIETAEAVKIPCIIFLDSNCRHTAIRDSEVQGYFMVSLSNTTSFFYGPHSIHPEATMSVTQPNRPRTASTPTMSTEPRQEQW